MESDRVRNLRQLLSDITTMRVFEINRQDVTDPQRRTQIDEYLANRAADITAKYGAIFHGTPEWAYFQLVTHPYRTTPQSRTTERAIDRYAREPTFFDTPVEELGLPTRTKNALIASCTTTLGLLVESYEDSLLRERGMGKKGIADIKSVLEGHNLSLGINIGYELPQNRNKQQTK